MRGVSQPTEMPPTMTPGSMSCGFGGGETGGGGGGIRLVGGCVVVVVGVRVRARRRRRERKPRGQAEQRADCEQARRRQESPVSRASVETNTAGLFTTTASTPTPSRRTRSRGSSTVQATTGTPRARAQPMSRGPTSEWCSASTDAPERTSSVPPRTGMAGRTVWSPTRITGVEPGRPEMRSRSSGNETPARPASARASLRIAAR